MSPLISLAFFLSGVSGLVYETIWTRYLGLYLGHRAYAQALVLAIFLGGTAAGALFTGATTRRLKRPLLAYAAAEALIGLVGLVFHKLFLGATRVSYDTIFPALAAHPALLLLTQWLIAAALILPQSLLLGTTYPLVSAALLRRRPGGSGRILALLYAVNSAGGAIGVLVTGFWLIGSFGLPGTAFAGGTISLVAAALAIAGGWPASAPHQAPGSDAGPDVGRGNLELPRSALLWVAFGTAATSLAYEVAWTRMLSLVLGSASHSFELMLSAFVLGMALGALWLRLRVDRLRDPVWVLGVVQWVMGGVAILSLPLYLATFQWTADLLTALTPTPQGYAVFTAFRYALCLAIMLPATFCAGVTLPLLTHILLRLTRDERVVGVAYGVNTVGAIAGVALAALLLMPLTGARGVLLGAALGDMALGVLVVALRDRRRARRTSLTWVAAALVLVFGTAWKTPFDRAVMTSGVYRTRRLPEPGLQRLLFYRDGLTATVSSAYTPPGRTTISTNGKVDASLDDAWFHKRPPGTPRRTLRDDAGTQTLMPLLGLAYAPMARQAAVIGHGSGMSAHFLLGSPNIESVTTVEIEPEMILGSAVFYPVNRRVFDDARSHFVNADARTFFTAPARYDLVLSEPSNPWVSGVSSLFTQEFYRRASGRLTRHGVFVQWLQLYETNDALLLDILAAVHQSFGSYVLYYTGAVDAVIVASNDSVMPAPDWSVVSWPLLAADLADFVPFTPQSLNALRFADRAVFAPLLDRLGSVSSDFHSALDRDAEEERYLNHNASGFVGLGSERFDPFMALTGRRYPVGAEPSTPVPEVPRAREAVVASQVHARADSVAKDLDAEARAVMLRVHMFETFIAGAAPPEDWQLWMRNFILVERNIHGLASGAVDERFYNRVGAYLQRAHAPSGAVDAVAFYRALAMWDFSAASSAVDRLLVPLALGINWVPAPTLRDGAVVSKMLIGDVIGARRAFEMLTPPVERASLRARLLDADIRDVEQRVKRAD